MTFSFDTSKFSQAAGRKVTLHDNCIVLDVGTGSFPRDIEVRLPDDDGARQIAIWDGGLDLAVDDVVLCNEYSGNPKWRVVAIGGADSGAGKTRVNKVWALDFTSESLVTDASDNVTINTGTLTVPSDIIHLSDPDNLISFDTDKQTYTVGGLVALQMTNTTQDLVEIGDVAGTGDWDINFNNGQMFLQGSDGFFGVNIVAPSTTTALLEVATTGNKGINSSAFSTTLTFAGEPTLTLAKSHSATIGTLTETIDTERLGRMDVTGVDSNDATRSTAGFRVTQVGAASGGNVPSKMELIAANNKVVLTLDENRDVIIEVGYLGLSEMTAPGAGAVNTARLYAVDNGAGKTQLIVIFNTGAAQVIATQP